MNTYRKQLDDFRVNAQHDCLVIHEDIKRLMDDATKMLDYNNSEIKAIYQHIGEKVKLKKLRYYYSEIMECLELADKLFEEIHEASQPKEEPTRKDHWDNDPHLTAIVDQIQRAMASLDTGDHAIIAVRKDSSEEVDNTDKQELTDIIRIMQENT